MVHLKRYDFQQHCSGIDQYLRELRIKRNLITADVEIICAQMQTDFLHSSIGAMHSSYIRVMLKCNQTPLRISLISYQYKAVSNVIDWMYNGEIQMAVEEYGEHLKIVNSLGVDKLKQNLESTLQILADQNDCIICCINIATDPECSISFMVQGIICKKFIATMHLLSDNDIQKLTLNAIAALVSSPHIKSKEKIDTVNFALQWLKNSTHSRFLDVVLESLYIEVLRSNQLTALVQHLRRLYRELPKSLLASIHIYISNKRIVISVFIGSMSEAESERKNVEIGKMIDDEVDTSYIAEINKLPNFEELIKIYYPISSGSQKFTNARIFTFKELSEQIVNFSGKYRISQGQKSFQYFDNIEVSLDIPRLAAAGTFDEKNDKGVGRHSLGLHRLRNNSCIPNQFSPRNSDIITALSAEERTIGRNAFSSDSIAEIQEIQNLFSHESTKKSRETTSTHASNPESITRINQLQTLLSNRPGTAGCQQTSGRIGRNSSPPSTKTINRNLHGVESITDIANIPNQFHGKRYFTPNLDHYLGGRRFVYNLTEQIRQAKDKLYGDLKTVNRYAFGEQSLADIREIKSQFSPIYNEKNPSEASTSSPYRTESLADMKAIPDSFSPKGTAATQPYARYTTSEIKDINAYPEFIREDQVIGKKTFTREEYEELRGIPSITDKEPRKSPIINRYELPDDEKSDIKNLPDIVDSQYAIGRGIYSEEEIQEIKALPDIHSYSSVSDSKLSTPRNICNLHTSAMRSSGSLSASVAPDMRCMISVLFCSARNFLFPELKL
ncbi:unnamed protein product [Cercopithifilaria johnstoni]|uniref:BTB domain-containing protein n=1 Tax=Cercopithifilaria johnstoni TaxID=2874296 RepID=A0A8J2Q3V4_9BILA|nr:unnamed protein product [Cercopithifilaria johnstoni]